MWIIAKYKKRELSIFKRELLRNSSSKVKYYHPKISIKNKPFSKYILGDYIFCYSKTFLDKNLIEHLKSTKGLKYFLLESLNNQSQIYKFINFCQTNEDKDGYLKNSCFNVSLEKKYKFLSGPVKDLIFNFISKNKKNFEIKLDNKKIFVKNNNFSFTAA